jgi:hypothetical protein
VNGRDAVTNFDETGKIRMQHEENNFTGGQGLRCRAGEVRVSSLDELWW